ncbi:nucleotidyltransferase family protein [Campylobacter sp. MIT 21-1685]|uniref:D-glycero-D-manno-heptose 1-phosphate guanosyltransferase n=1 Tax=unclassified Campylobacter TaxID=2593542 RepID=UPI00224B0389|nr:MULTISPECIES: nucleotidyltransferase family protein [unclassified Campylobacter]MCX2683320.1 nucleotidyltransferase family protein [Campylobacter sp. MIT 21-1684]MCX2751625.1 nucleotidyltransferase family protein [Campylobacter sp. MIT 21-1682]MCX2807824.1 nucleotidyltransferase family protein [Campylobacter sp. MIT 21-1685]
MQSIVLAGGFGTRLKEVLQNTPKPMARVANKPFLEYILEHLKSQGISKIVLCVCYEKEQIMEYFKENFKGLQIVYSIEEKPLGTGGAVKKALEFIDDEKCFVCNGDTFFAISLKNLQTDKDCKLCLALKKMYNFERYANVIIDKQDFISSFKEKQFCKEGFINAGSYLVQKDIFENFNLQENFSFEEFIQTHFKTLKAKAVVYDNFFIDIGVPDEYFLAQTLFNQNKL